MSDNNTNSSTTFSPESNVSAPTIQTETINQAEFNVKIPTGVKIMDNLDEIKSIPFQSKKPSEMPDINDMVTPNLGKIDVPEPETVNQANKALDPTKPTALKSFLKMLGFDEKDDLNSVVQKLMNSQMAKKVQSVPEYLTNDVFAIKEKETRDFLNKIIGWSFAILFLTLGLIATKRLISPPANQPAYQTYDNIVNDPVFQKNVKMSKQDRAAQKQVGNYLRGKNARLNVVDPNSFPSTFGLVLSKFTFANFSIFIFFSALIVGAINYLTEKYRIESLLNFKKNILKRLNGGGDGSSDGSQPKKQKTQAEIDQEKRLMEKRIKMDQERLKKYEEKISTGEVKKETISQTKKMLEEKAEQTRRELELAQEQIRKLQSQKEEAQSKSFSKLGKPASTPENQVPVNRTPIEPEEPESTDVNYETGWPITKKAAEIIFKDYYVMMTKKLYLPNFIEVSGQMDTLNSNVKLTRYSVYVYNLLRISNTCSKIALDKNKNYEELFSNLDDVIDINFSFDRFLNSKEKHYNFKLIDKILNNPSTPTFLDGEMIKTINSVPFFPKQVLLTSIPRAIIVLKTNLFGRLNENYEEIVKYFRNSDLLEKYFNLKEEEEENEEMEESKKKNVDPRKLMLYAFFIIICSGVSSAAYAMNYGFYCGVTVNSSRTAILNEIFKRGFNFSNIKSELYKIWYECFQGNLRFYPIFHSMTRIQLDAHIGQLLIELNRQKEVLFDPYDEARLKTVVFDFIAPASLNETRIKNLPLEFFKNLRKGLMKQLKNIQLADSKETLELLNNLSNPLTSMYGKIMGNSKSEQANNLFKANKEKILELTNAVASASNLDSVENLYSKDMVNFFNLNYGKSDIIAIELVDFWFSVNNEKSQLDEKEQEKIRKIVNIPMRYIDNILIPGSLSLETEKMIASQWKRGKELLGDKQNELIREILSLYPLQEEANITVTRDRTMSNFDKFETAFYVWKRTVLIFFASFAENLDRNIYDIGYIMGYCLPYDRARLLCSLFDQAKLKYPNFKFENANYDTWYKLYKTNLMFFPIDQVNTRVRLDIIITNLAEKIRLQNEPQK